jgi:hypothetical protein
VSEPDFVENVTVPNRPSVDLANNRDICKKEAASRDAFENLGQHRVASLPKIDPVRLEPRSINNDATHGRSKHIAPAGLEARVKAHRYKDALVSGEWREEVQVRIWIQFQSLVLVTSAQRRGEQPRASECEPAVCSTAKLGRMHAAAPMELSASGACSHSIIRPVFASR